MSEFKHLRFRRSTNEIGVPVSHAKCYHCGSWDVATGFLDGNKMRSKFFLAHAKCPTLVVGSLSDLTPRGTRNDDHGKGS